MKRNGARDTFSAVMERLEMRARGNYSYLAPDDGELAKQRKETGDAEGRPSITIVMPAYNTPQEFLKEAVDSVIAQSYPYWRLIVCDASDKEHSAGVSGDRTDASCAGCSSVGDVMAGYSDEERIVYLPLAGNRGISGNSNAGIEAALGTSAAASAPDSGSSPSYICFLDHDDVLAPDALYHMARAIRSSEASGISPALLYSDEDKVEAVASAASVHHRTSASGETDGTNAVTYFDPHRKYDFNFDLLLTNNYICHLMLVRADLLGEIRFRSEYDGAQDYDLVLQIVTSLIRSGIRITDLGRYIIHVPRILYHWRSHRGSTATNTSSKEYAYEAGLHAVTDAVNTLFRTAGHDNTGYPSVRHSKHRGFYETDWGVDRRSASRDSSGPDYGPLFALRPDIGAVAGRVLTSRGRMAECIADEHGSWLYAGTPRTYAGELNRFDCAQDVYMADRRYVTVRPELDDLLHASVDDADFASKLRAEGYLIYYDPGDEQRQ